MKKQSERTLSVQRCILWLFTLGVFTSTFNFFFKENMPIPIADKIINVIDELSVILILLITLKRGHTNRNKTFLICIILFSITGFIGNVLYGSTLTVFVLGMFNTMKPLILFWCLCQYNFNWRHFYYVMRFYICFFPIIVVSYILDILIPGFRAYIGIQAQVDDFRMGLRCLGGLFSRYTYAVVYGMIYYLYFSFYAPQKKTWLRLFSVLMVLGGLRVKDIIAFCVGNTFIFFKRIKTVSLAIIFAIGTVMFSLYTIFMPEHYALYFESGDDSNVARVVLGYTSLKIANDNMPFGAGFGMFASPISRQYKSHVYSDYGIDSVYGLDFERDGGMYMCDSFWPMLIGETGFLGTLLYIVILYVGFRPFIKRFLKNTRDIYAIFPTFLFITFLITSVGKPVFTGPPHALILWGFAGIFYSFERKNKNFEYTNCKQL